MSIDIWLLILFVVGVTLFLILERKKLIREGPLFLYKTKIGLNIIETIAKKYKKTIKFLCYLSVGLGYIMMAVFTSFFLYSMVKSIYLYFIHPRVIEIISAPPLMLLIPYFPKIFGVEEFFPAFPFMYFIIAIAIVAIVHEGAHGIVARYHGVKIKSTGFGFLGPILAFFVEQDDKQMQKSKIFPQLAILSAGVFANIGTMIVFLIILISFFHVSYIPAGVEFNSYSYATIPEGSIQDLKATSEIILVGQENFTKILIENKSYFIKSIILEQNLLNRNINYSVNVYYDLPAIKNELRGVIVEMNGHPIKNLEDYKTEINKYASGEKIEITTNYQGNIENKQIVLNNPYNISGNYLGIMVGNSDSMNFFRMFEFFKEKGTYYESKYNPILANYIYYLLGWIVLINLLVALFNILPVGIFDGGRFFYLTILKISGKKKTAELGSKIATKIFLALILLIFIAWGYAKIRARIGF